MSHLFVIGGHKCGSTWLSHVLGQHSQINNSAIKEPHYFSHRLENGVNWYRGLWEIGSNGLNVEYSTHYYINPSVYSLIENFDELSKYIIIYRNPLERLISDLMHKRRDGSIRDNLTDLSEFMLRYPDSRQLSSFGTYISEWMALAGDNLLCIEFDKIVNAPLETMRTIENFLVLDQFMYQDINKKVGAGYTPRSKTFEILKNMTFEILSRHPKLIRFVRDRNLDVLYRKLNAKKEKPQHFAITQNDFEFLKEDVLKLSRQLGVDFVHKWMFEPEPGGYLVLKSGIQIELINGV